MTVIVANHSTLHANVNRPNEVLYMSVLVVHVCMCVCMCVCLCVVLVYFAHVYACDRQCERCILESKQVQYCGTTATTMRGKRCYMKKYFETYLEMVRT